MSVSVSWRCGIGPVRSYSTAVTFNSEALSRFSRSVNHLFVSAVDSATKSLLLKLRYFPSVIAFVCVSNT